jgi:serine/threonine protein kinase
MASYSPFEYYQVDQVLTLSVVPKHGEIHSASTVHARIRQLQNPRTLSCCMIVDLLGEGSPENPVFLKLYDRRFSEQLRRDHGIDPWTMDAEKEYINAVRTGAARQFLRNLQTIPNFEEDTEETWDNGQIETFLTDQAHKLFDAETIVYDTLRDIQGKLVPRLVARVHLALSLPNAGIGHTDAAELLHIKGILLQYIDGFSLSKVQDHAPKSEWQGIVDQAVAIVQVVGDHGILNRDVRPDSFIVQRDKSGCYWVFMIDFGLARLRGWNESDRDWAKAKLTKDEEGAVGLVMKKRLAREGFELRFENSDRYMEWAGGDDE